MAQNVVIANPIINSPFAEPSRHFFFDEEGITDRIVESRRRSEYFVPIARPKKKSKGQAAHVRRLDRRPDRREQDGHLHPPTGQRLARGDFCGNNKEKRAAQVWLLGALRKRVQLR
jgi:hypothetical protein